MKPIAIVFKREEKRKAQPLYLQLYEYIRGEIIKGNMRAGEKLPSLRKISKDLGISITTSELAYSQLLVEGYVITKPQSGYYVAEILATSHVKERPLSESYDISRYTFPETEYLYDLDCFDFNKWKKAMWRVLADHSNLLFFAGDPQGEAALRYEISKYIYSSRGVVCKPEQIVIGAGTQQITAYLSRILKKMDINTVATEDPGYLPVEHIFSEAGYGIAKVPVDKEGIDVSMLPRKIKSAVYVSPSNQFPTGAVMSINRRYQLLDWADKNHSYIIEDDYDSELRYFGKPVPALQGLTENEKVIYLGSFSSTLFPSIRISYMVLPGPMLPTFEKMKEDYTQTCSKTEQLTLAFFMEDGHYFTNIKKLRNLYGQKLNLALSALERYGKDFVEPQNNSSGLNIILKVRSPKDPKALSKEAKELGILVTPVADFTGKSTEDLIFYYSRIPLKLLDDVVAKMIDLWKK